MVTVADALAVNTPAVALLMVSVHERVAPTPAVGTVAAQTRLLVVRGPLGLTLEVGVAMTIGALAAVAVTTMLNTWAWPTSFTASGVIEMWASTYSLRR